MTENQLARANEIKSEISGLQRALMQLYKAKLFGIEDGGCGYVSSCADAFLAKLHIDTIKMATDAINDGIDGLEKEFLSL